MLEKRKGFVAVKVNKTRLVVFSYALYLPNEYRTACNVSQSVGQSNLAEI